MNLHKKTKWIRIFCLALVFILCLPAIQFIINPGVGANATTNQTMSYVPLGGSSRGSRATIDREIADKDVMYAIIAPKNFTNILIPLVNWKTYKGVPAKIFTLDSIYTNFTSGRDNAEKVPEKRMIRYRKGDCS